MQNDKKLKILVIALAVVAVALGAILTWLWTDRKGVIDQLTIEKDQLTFQMIELRDEYDSLTTTNDTLNLRLDLEREKVEQLIERVQKTEATNRSKIRQYEKELGTLRSIMRGYIVQIDSLNTLNIALRQQTAKAEALATESRKRYDQLLSTTEELGKKVEAGSVVKGRGFSAVALNASAKESNRSSRVVKFRTCLFLVENPIAAKGLKMVYLRVKSPEGALLTEDPGQFFSFAGEQLGYSSAREVDYQGEELELCIFFTGVEGFKKGVYTIDIYTEESHLGSTEILLR
ncbi:MAG: hypothetical protein WC960_00130 [Bacteroidales bacterium]